MHILITTGPTREPLDDVRFLTNASSGRMGVALARAAQAAGHDVTLLAGPIADALLADARDAGAAIVPFVRVADLQAALAEHFPRCDVLLMAAAVGDFRPADRHAGKLSRKAGPVTITLEPTPDLVAAIAREKRPDQTVVTFAVETGDEAAVEAKARDELRAKHADLVVVNTPDAMAADDSRACILSADTVLEPWARRTKETLATQILRHVESCRTRSNP